MDFENIQKIIKDMEAEISAFGEYEEELEPYQSVAEFNTNIDALKDKIQKDGDETVFFKNVFNTQDYYENISSYLSQIQVSIEQKIKKSGVSPEANYNLQQSLKLVAETIDLLVIEYGNLVKNDKKNFFSQNGTRRNKIRLTLSNLVELKKKIENIIYRDSKIVSNVLLKEFKTLYTFFANCIKVAKSRQDELLLVEVAGISDRLMSMIYPVFRNKSLSVSELIYYYLFFELRELKASAIGNRLA